MLILLYINCVLLRFHLRSLRRRRRRLLLLRLLLLILDVRLLESMLDVTSFDSSIWDLFLSFSLSLSLSRSLFFLFHPLLQQRTFASV